MAKEIVIFGDGKIADVIQFYMREVSEWPVAAFTVDDDVHEEHKFNGLPVLPYSDFKEQYGTDDTQCFAAVGYHDLNRLRASKVNQLKDDGYELISYIHPDAGIPSDLTYGENTFIMDRALIHPRVSLGSNNFIWSGTILGHHSSIGHHNWFTSGCNISGNVTIGDCNFFAINATVSQSITIHDECFLGANALVTQKVNNKQVIIAENNKPVKLNSDQFLKFSNFESL